MDLNWIELNQAEVWQRTRIFTVVKIQKKILSVYFW